MIGGKRAWVKDAERKELRRIQFSLAYKKKNWR